MQPAEMDVLVGGNARAARARLRLRQLDIADDMGWTRPTVTALEKGERRLSLPEAVKLCGVLRIDLYALLQGLPPDTLTALGLPPRRS